MKSLVFLLIFLLGFNTSASEFIVAGSANIHYALEDLNKEFAKDSGKLFKTVTSSSGKLATQIQNGAPFSIFLSADMDYPKLLFNSGHAITEPKEYARGGLVIWTKGNWGLKEFPLILLDEKVKSIAVANPDTAPYGRETIRALEYYKVYEKIKSKLVYAESISQVNQYVVSGSVDFGFTAKSIVTASEMSGKGNWVELAAKSYKPIQQGVVVLKYGLDNHNNESKNFYNFLFSSKAKIILRKHGYLVDEL